MEKTYQRVFYGKLADSFFVLDQALISKSNLKKRLTLLKKRVQCFDILNDV